MNSESLVHWPALPQLALLGSLLALAPLTWVWLKRAPKSISKHNAADENQQALNAWRKLNHLALLTVFLCFDLIVFGAFTRLTDSGLGCPDWPGCYGQLTPWQSKDAIAIAEAALPTGPVTWVKAWIEMIHRYLAAMVGVLIVVQAVFVARVKQVRRWGFACLIWVCVQGAFGAYTVTLKLMPIVVSLHLLGGMLLLVLLWRLRGAINAHYSDLDNTRKRSKQPLGLAARLSHSSIDTQQLKITKTWLQVAHVLLWVQLALGAWVSTNYAVLACTDFPLCHGKIWPAMDFQSAYHLTRDLGRDRMGGFLTSEALTAIHYTHRTMAYVVFIVLGGLVWQLLRDKGQAPKSRLWAKALLHLLLWQLATGLGNVLLGWPLLAAVAHTAGAAGLVLVLTQLRVMQPTKVGA